MGNEIIATKKYELPSSYREVFEILGKKKLIGKETKDAIIELVKIRNTIAHRYFVITPKKLFDSIRKTWSIKRFANEIESLIK